MGKRCGATPFPNPTTAAQPKGAPGSAGKPSAGGSGTEGGAAATPGASRLGASQQPSQGEGASQRPAASGARGASPAGTARRDAGTSKKERDYYGLFLKPVADATLRRWAWLGAAALACGTGAPCCRLRCMHSRAAACPAPAGPHPRP